MLKLIMSQEVLEVLRKVISQRQDHVWRSELETTRWTRTSLMDSNKNSQLMSLQLMSLPVRPLLVSADIRTSLPI